MLLSKIEEMADFFLFRHPIKNYVFFSSQLAKMDTHKTHDQEKHNKNTA